MPLLPRAALAALALSAAFGLALFLVPSLPGDRQPSPKGRPTPLRRHPRSAALGLTAAPGTGRTGRAPCPALADPGRSSARRPPLNLGKPPAIRSDAALVVDEGGTPVLAKHSQAVKPIASITKLMTAVVVLDSGVDLDQSIEITPADRDNCATVARACAPTRRA